MVMFIADTLTRKPPTRKERTMTSSTSENRTAPATQAKPSVVSGVLPFIGLILFVIATAVQFAQRPATGEWETTLVLNAITYLIGWAGIGAGIAHIFFGKSISRSIGFGSSPFELEVGFANLAMGVVAILAANHGSDYWWAIILVSAIYRLGCGVGHVISIVRDRNLAVNNTAILFIDFVVPAFLIVAYSLWAPVV
jgi:hypothetical protein